MYIKDDGDRPTETSLDQKLIRINSEEYMHTVDMRNYTLEKIYTASVLPNCSNRRAVLCFPPHELLL